MRVTNVSHQIRAISNTSVLCPGSGVTVVTVGTAVQRNVVRVRQHMIHVVLLANVPFLTDWTISVTVDKIMFLHFKFRAKHFITDRAYDCLLCTVDGPHVSISFVAPHTIGFSTPNCIRTTEDQLTVFLNQMCKKRLVTDKVEFLTMWTHAFGDVCLFMRIIRGKVCHHDVIVMHSVKFLMHAPSFSTVKALLTTFTFLPSEDGITATIVTDRRHVALRGVTDDINFDTIVFCDDVHVITGAGREHFVTPATRNDIQL